MTMDNQLMKQENVALIVQNAPQAFRENKDSKDKCVAFGEALLAKVRDDGMDDDMDKQIAVFIERARKTVVKMNTKRSPVTKLFDDIRKVFTEMENSIDPSKTGTVAWQLQQERNNYAAKKRAEEEKRRQEELLRQRHDNALKKYRVDIESEASSQFTKKVDAAVKALYAKLEALTLTNYEDTVTSLALTQAMLEPEWRPVYSTPRPLDLTRAEAERVRQDVWDSLHTGFEEQYRFEIDSNKQSIVDILPSKKKTLEAMATADAAKKEQLAIEVAEREKKMALEREAERKAKEEEQKQQQALQQQSASMNDLFAQAQAKASTYQPKTSVKWKIVPKDAEAFTAIIAMWWSKEGVKMSVEELSKTFKKQLTYCEKLANDKSDPIRVKSDHIEYVEDIKAK